MKRHIFIRISGLLFIFGILLTGSCGPWFPWPNALGLFLMAVGALIANQTDLTAA